MILIVDYGMSNLRSIRRGLEYVGGQVEVSSDPARLRAARGIVLPGDGAFGQTMHNLRAGGWVEPLREAVLGRRTPFLGICLGMQLLFEKSEELGQHTGLGFLRGEVRRFAERAGKVPQIGWNQLRVRPGSRFLEGVPDGSYVYFVHSYYCAPTNPGVIAASSDYYGEYAAVIEQDNVWGSQFHPEKSQRAGLQMLANFVRVTS